MKESDSTLSCISRILVRVFADPKIVKVMHGADHDILWLQRDFSVYVVNMFDTGQAARVLNLPKVIFLQCASVEEFRGEKE